MSDGFIYFLRCGDFVKIGWSVKPDIRTRALKTANPYQVDVIGVWPARRHYERLLHRQFRNVRHESRREWFVLTPEIFAIAETGLPDIEPNVRLHGTRQRQNKPIDALTLSVLELAECYKGMTGVGLAALGKEILRDSGFFNDLRDGRSCQINTMMRVSKWFSDRWPSGVEWPEGLPRPKAETAA